MAGQAAGLRTDRFVSDHARQSIGGRMSDTCFGRTQHQTRERIQESQVVIQCRWPSTMQQRRVSHVPSGSRTLLGTENLKENRNEAALAHPRPVDIDDEQDGRT